MISEATQAILQTLLANQAAYRPNAATQAALQSKTLVMLVSATCMGKSTIMQHLSNGDAGVQVVGTCTSRPARSDDDHTRYTYYAHTDAGLKPLLDAIAQGTVIQYAINPYSNYIYASTLSDYPGTLNVGDYFSSVIDSFRQYGFGQTLPITIVSDPASWRARFEQRFPVGHEQRTARLQEAAESLRWSLAQTHDHHWVINPEGKSPVAASAVLQAIRGEVPASGTQSQARQLAADCLQTIEDILA